MVSKLILISTGIVLIMLVIIGLSETRCKIPFLKDLSYPQMSIGLAYPSSLRLDLTTVCPHRKSHPISTEIIKSPNIIDVDYVKVRFKPGINKEEFAKRYELSIKDVGEESPAGLHLVRVPRGLSPSEAVDIFSQDPDVEEANLLVRRTIF